MAKWPEAVCFPAFDPMGDQAHEIRFKPRVDPFIEHTPSVSLELKVEPRGPGADIPVIVLDMANVAPGSSWRRGIGCQMGEDRWGTEDAEETEGAKLVRDLAGRNGGWRARIKVVAELKPELEGVTVVLVGAFNPGIFHPAWFGREKLIQREEAERADLKIVSPQVSVFSVGWVGLEVTLDRFAAQTTQIQYLESLRDLVLGTFTLLRHTPIKQMGINRLAHYRCPSEDEWHKVGHRLAPKEPWGDLLQKPGMRRLSMLGQRPDQYQGSITVTVEPSVVLKPGFGVYFEVNDHYVNDVDENGNECDRMLEILRACWQPSLDRASHLVQTLMKTP